ncbi:MAG: putative lipase [Oligoflexia bacterium]|nr:putative lipase [Oligoflexia bacterium]
MKKSRALALGLAISGIAALLSADHWRRALRAPAAAYDLAFTTRHVVFLIHGIGGNAGHFGSMKPALEARGLEVVPFEYDTGSAGKNTYTFAQEFGEFLKSYFDRSGELGEGDRISLVMHSQGGLVGTIWLARAFAGDSRFHPEFASRIDAFITLGTPFWGAKTAVFGSTVRRLADSLGVPFPLPFGPQELQEMSFGSHTITRFRRLAVDEEFARVRGEIQSRVRLLNIAAIATQLKLLAPFASDAREYEDDSAVPLPSARFDFIHLTQKPHRPATVGFMEFAPFRVVEALHLSPLPESENFPGIAQVPERCVSNPNCRHPTFKIVADHLQGRPVPEGPPLPSPLTSFMLELSIRAPQGVPLRPEEVSIELPPSQNGLRLADPLELYSHGKAPARGAAEFPNEARFYYMGYLRPERAKIENEAGSRTNLPANPSVRLRVRAPGFARQEVQAAVRPATSTYVEIELSNEAPPP